MKTARGLACLSAIAAILIVSGCGTVEDVFLSAFKEAAVDAVKTATSQFAEEAALKVETGLEQLATEAVTNTLTPTTQNN